MKNDFKPVPRKDNVVVQELNGEVLIYDLGENKAFCLNETSALVWQACNGEKNVAEISRELSGKLDSPVNEDLVWLALDQLKKENLIENKDEVVADFGGMSRREVIRKVGFASIVALPLISSLVAPPAISAQSAGACTGQACSNNVACPSGCRCLNNQGAPTNGTGTCQV